MGRAEAFPPNEQGAYVERDPDEIIRKLEARIAELEAAADRACSVFVEPYGTAHPNKKIGDWRVEMLNAMRALRDLVPQER